MGWFHGRGFLEDLVEGEGEAYLGILGDYLERCLGNQNFAHLVGRKLCIEGLGLGGLVHF